MRLGELMLRWDGACLREGVARRPWMAGGMGTDGKLMALAPASRTTSTRVAALPLLARCISERSGARRGRSPGDGRRENARLRPIACWMNFSDLVPASGTGSPKFVIAPGLIGGCRVNPPKCVDRSTVRGVGKFSPRFVRCRPICRHSNNGAPMVMSHDQLMHQDAEWFSRQPHRLTTALGVARGDSDWNANSIKCDGPLEPQARDGVHRRMPGP